MFRRVVFNIVVKNQDDHTKNISFLMDRQGKWSLSPAYDMNYSYNPEGVWTAAHQMSVNGKFDNITRSDLLKLAERNNIRNASDIIEEICTVCSGWGIIAKDCGVPQSITDSILPKMGLLQNS